MRQGFSEPGSSLRHAWQKICLKSPTNKKSHIIFILKVFSPKSTFPIITYEKTNSNHPTLDIKNYSVNIKESRANEILFTASEMQS